MQRFLKAGFVLKEDIIKVQHNCRTTERWKPKAQAGKFYLIMHEHLFVFRKPKAAEDLARLRYSRTMDDRRGTIDLRFAIFFVGIRVHSWLRIVSRDS